MATITATVRENLIGIYMGMFKKAPGADAVSEMVVMWEANKTQKQIAAELAKKPAFGAEYPGLQLPSEFADEVVAWLASEATSAGKSWATNWIIGKVNAGISKSDIIVEAVLALRVATNTTDFGSAKANLNNKVAVGVYYAVTKDQKADSSEAVANVTSVASTVDSAKTSIDNTAAAETGKSYDLTVGIDTITGTSGNDTIVANTSGAVIALTSFDNIDGGAGKDTMNISVTAAVALSNAVNATVKNVEVVNITSGATVDGDVGGWTGLTDLTVIGKGGNTGLTAATSANITLTDSALAASKLTVDGGKAVTVSASGLTNLATEAVNIGGTTAATGAVTVTTSGNLAANTQVLGDVTVKGGSSVSITQTVAPTAAYAATVLTGSVTESISSGDVKVTGTAATTSVTVQDTASRAAVNSASAGVVGITNGTVTIDDVNKASATAAGSIKSVTLTNFGAATINSGALDTLTLGGKGTSVGVTAGALTTAVVNTLALTTSGLTTTGAVTLDADYKTVNLNSTGSAASTINTLTASGAAALNVSGDKLVTLSNQTLASSATVTVSNSAGATFSSALAADTTFTGGAGVETITVGATTKAIATGAGDDSVTATGAITGTIDAGDGTDTLVIADATAVTLSATTTFAGKISNFERLSVTGTTAANQTIDMANLDSINYITVAGVNVGNTLAFTNTATGLTLNANAGAAGTLSAALASDSTGDVVNLNISAATAQTINSLTLTGFETINIATDQTGTAAGIAHVITTLTDAQAKTVTISGDAGLNLGTFGSTAVTSFNASGVTKGAVNYTTAALASAATLTGGAGNDNINAALATKTVTLSGNDGNDVLFGGLGDDTIDGGAGADIIVGGAGKDSLSGGAGADAFVVAVATHSNGVNQDTIKDFVAGTDKIATGINTITYAGEAAGYGAVLTSLSGTARQAVLDTSTSTLYIDVDGNKVLDNADITILLSGVTDLSQSDFGVVGTTGADTFVVPATGIGSLFGFDTATPDVLNVSAYTLGLLKAYEEVATVAGDILANSNVIVYGGSTTIEAAAAAIAADATVTGTTGIIVVGDGANTYVYGTSNLDTNGTETLLVTLVGVANPLDLVTASFTL